MKKTLIYFLMIASAGFSCQQKGTEDSKSLTETSKSETAAGKFGADINDSGVANSGELPAFLPPEAQQTLTLIQRGGPFPHRQDGSVFQNREGRLPRQSRGYYREYTVDTPGLDHRGERRIVTGFGLQAHRPAAAT